MSRRGCLAAGRSLRGAFAPVLGASWSGARLDTPRVTPWVRPRVVDEGPPSGVDAKTKMKSARRQTRTHMSTAVRHSRGVSSTHGVGNAFRDDVTIRNTEMDMDNTKHPWETVVGLELHVQLATRTKLFSNALRIPLHEKNTSAETSETNTRVAPFDAGWPGALPSLNMEAVGLAARLGVALGGVVQKKSAFDRKHYAYADQPHGYQVTQKRFPIVLGGGLDFFVDEDDTADDGDSKKEKGLPQRQNKVHLPIECFQLETDTGKSALVRTREESGSGTKESVPHDTPTKKQEWLVDYNRAGNALVEIVCLPSLRSAKSAAAAVQAFQQTVRFLGVSDANMEDGSLRVDVNVSVRRVERSFASSDGRSSDSSSDSRSSASSDSSSEPSNDSGSSAISDGRSSSVSSDGRGSSASRDSFGARCEIKNLNSLKSVAKAVAYEAKRQIQILQSGGVVTQETRGYDEKNDVTFTLRKKSDLVEYRFAPEPDVPAVVFSEFEVLQIQKQLPELPNAALLRLTDLFGKHKLRYELSKKIAAHPTTLAFYEAALVAAGAGKHGTFQVTDDENIEHKSETETNDDAKHGNETPKPTDVAHFVVGELVGAAKRLGLVVKANAPLSCLPESASAELVGELLRLVGSNLITARMAKKTIAAMLAAEKDANGSYPTATETVAVLFPSSGDDGERQSGLGDSHTSKDSSHEKDVQTLCASVLASMPEQVSLFRAGKTRVMGLFVGEVLKRTHGTADPRVVSRILKGLMEDTTE